MCPPPPAGLPCPQGPCPVTDCPPPAPGRVVRNVLRPSRDPRVTCPLLTDWDNPSCTEGVVSVSRGERVVMSCNISNPFLGVTVYLIALGEDSQPLFRVTPPGCFCRGEWQLQVCGGVAQLVIPKASDAQAGCYKWHLKGLQRNIKVTTPLGSPGLSPPSEPGTHATSCLQGWCPP
uniref:Secreted and transmembrane protein 1 n=1 Tax=Panthera leo TaxID=9689 RepID=A0A8C8XGP4_PANLE